ncbi:MAG: methyltransferase domain-containing protein [Patescibacteria group bacterium]|nr:methyltransferase domain-containing protein [Patescibacteria group bacterium]
MFPYFDRLREELIKNNFYAKQAWSDHVHWGYWEKPDSQKINRESFSAATVALSQKIIAKAAIQDGYKILDVGCGFGGTIRMLNEKHHYCELIGLNIDGEQLAVAKKLTKSRNHNTIKFVQADACDLHFEKEYFDVIITIESIFHFFDRKRFLQEASRVLKPKGKLVLSDFVPILCASKILNRIENTFNLAGKAYGKLNIDINKNKYQKISRQSGLSIKKIEDITKNTLPTYKILKEYFSTMSQKDNKVFSSATSWIEFPSRFGLLKYLLISMEKNES